MKKTIASILFLAAAAALSGAESSKPRYFAARTGDLAAVKTRLIAGDAALQPALRALVKSADEALKIAPPSVTQKTKLAPDGDPHSYASTAPYFWPDPTKPDGLPYIAHDGKVNPESRTAASDLQRVELMSRTVETLALAFYFTDKVATVRSAAAVR